MVHCRGRKEAKKNKKKDRPGRETETKRLLPDKLRRSENHNEAGTLQGLGKSENSKMKSSMKSSLKRRKEKRKERQSRPSKRHAMQAAQ